MSYEIRLPDINSDPFYEDGHIKFPISEIMDYKKLGLKATPESETRVKRK